MRLPRFTATTPPPRFAGLARASDIGALTRTGDEAFWRSIGQVGGALKDVAGLGYDAYEKRRAVDDEIEAGVASQRLVESFNEADEVAGLMDVTTDMPLPDDPDYLKTLTSFSTIKRDELLDDALKGIEKDAKEIFQGIKAPLTKARLENWYKSYYAGRVGQLKHEYGTKLNDYQTGEVEKLWQSAAANGNVETANFYIDIMDKYELITHKQALVYKQQVEKIAAKSNLEQLEDAVLTVALTKRIPPKDEEDKRPPRLDMGEVIKYIEGIKDLPEAAKTDLIAEVAARDAQEQKALEQQAEIDRGEIYDAIEAGQVELEDGTVSTDIRAFIESTSLDEDAQADMWEKAKKESDRKLKGEEIITDSQLRSQLYKDVMSILTGAQTRDEILEKVKKARFGDYSDPKNPQKPTLNEVDYKSLVAAINAQYEQGYGQMMSKVNSYAEGILLQKDALGMVTRGPVRYKNYGDFQEAWLVFVANKGDKLKIADIYPEGRKLAASFQLSDSELQEREDELEQKLRQREEGGGFGKRPDGTQKGKRKKERLPPDNLIPRERMELIDMSEQADDETRRELELIVETGDIKLIRKAMARLRGSLN